MAVLGNFPISSLGIMLEVTCHLRDESDCRNHDQYLAFRLLKHMPHKEVDDQRLATACRRDQKDSGCFCSLHNGIPLMIVKRRDSRCLSDTAAEQGIHILACQWGNRIFREFVLNMVATISRELGDIVLQPSVDRCLCCVVEFDVPIPSRLAETGHVFVIGNLEGEAIAQLLCGSALTSYANEY